MSVQRSPFTPRKTGLLTCVARSKSRASGRSTYGDRAIGFMTQA